MFGVFFFLYKEASKVSHHSILNNIRQIYWCYNLWVLNYTKPDLFSRRPTQKSSGVKSTFYTDLHLYSSQHLHFHVEASLALWSFITLPNLLMLRLRTFHVCVLHTRYLIIWKIAELSRNQLEPCYWSNCTDLLFGALFIHGPAKSPHIASCIL